VRAETHEQARPLKTGLTTGSCATACCVAAAHALFANKQPEIVTIQLPPRKKQTIKEVELTIHDYQISENRVVVSTIKDAGDDPDVTHRAIIFVALSLSDKPGIVFSAAKGVGTVTRAGLPLAVGEPAINPVPRKMMTEHLKRLAIFYDYKGGFKVSIGVKNGKEIAQKTMNARLGILGGLSILGTTGIVRPFSCSAYIASIHRGIDVALANGCEHIAASTGNSSEKFIAEYYQLPDMALIEMGDFAGGVLKYIKRIYPVKPVKKLSICGGFGKISKLANGNLDLHSRSSAIDFNTFARYVTELGGSPRLVKSVLKANTSMQVLSVCQDENIDIASIICQQALQKVQSILPVSLDVEIWAINRAGVCVGKALQKPG
jgi:cobalt-precorrin-5B (C1)-methyltransferase